MSYLFIFYRTTFMIITLNSPALSFSEFNILSQHYNGNINISSTLYIYEAKLFINNHNKPLYTDRTNDIYKTNKTINF